MATTWSDLNNSEVVHDMNKRAADLKDQRNKIPADMDFDKKFGILYFYSLINNTNQETQPNQKTRTLNLTKTEKRNNLKVTMPQNTLQVSISVAFRRYSKGLLC